MEKKENRKNLLNTQLDYSCITSNLDLSCEKNKTNNKKINILK